MQALKLNDFFRRLPRKYLLLGTLIALAFGIFLIAGSNPPDAAIQTLQNADTKRKASYRNRTLWHDPAIGDMARHATPPIRGTIYDLNGMPLAGATVFATTFENAGNVTSTAGSSASDTHGRFMLHLPDGLYYVHGDREGYGPSYVVAHSGDDISIVLSKSGILEGRVHDERGEPVPSFTIDVVTLAPEELAAPPPLWSKRFHNPDGSFRVDRLPDWPVMLRASAPNYAPAFSSLVKAEPGQTRELVLTMARGCTMVGQVLDPTGTPAPDVLVNAETRLAAGVSSDVSVAAGSEAQSDAEGRFRLENVPSGDVMVRGYDGIHAVTTVAVQVSDCESLEPLQLRMAAGGAVTGVVRQSDGTPIPGARLTLSHRSIGFVNTISDADGRYRFDQLPPDSMRLEAYLSERHTATHVSVQEGQLVEKDITLFGKGSGELRGRITAGGMPLAGMKVLVAANRGPEGMDMFSPRTGADGTFRLPELLDGSYMVIISSTSRLGAAHIESGNTATVDLDVAVKPQLVAAPEEPQADIPQ